MTFLILYCKEQSTREVLKNESLRLFVLLITFQLGRTGHLPGRYLNKKGGISGWELPLERSYHLLEAHIKFSKSETVGGMRTVDILTLFCLFF